MRNASWQVILAPALATLTLAGMAHGPCYAVQPSDRDFATASRLFGRARDLEEMGDLPEAAAKLTTSIELAPDWAPPHALMGKIRQCQGRDDEARGQYQVHQSLALAAAKSKPRAELRARTTEAEALLILNINRERLSRGLCALTPSVGLSRISRGHSREMRELAYFSHHSPDKSHETVVERFVSAYGRKPRVVGENLARHFGSNYSFTLANIAQSHARFMSSPTHRRCILWEKLRQVGVGVIVNERGDYWITETFAGNCDSAMR